MADAVNILQNAKEQLNILFGNMIPITDTDMEAYDKCFTDVFRNGITFSYMSSTFFAQFASEILVGALSSNPFRKFLSLALEQERGRTEPGEYWDETMETLRFGLPGVDDAPGVADVMSMMNTSYVKIMALNEWYGTPDGKAEFDMYCLSGRAIRDIKAVICELPYLIRRYDYDKQFAGEIMEYAGIVAEQIKSIAGEA